MFQSGLRPNSKVTLDPKAFERLDSALSRYVIGTRSALVRWILSIRGIEGDKKRGIADLRLAAERGRYLASFARMVLALIYVREKNLSDARSSLAQLRRDFPRNPLFAPAMDRLDAGVP